MAAAQTPSVGRIVHFRSKAGIRPAIIVAIAEDGGLHLQVFVDPTTDGRHVSSRAAASGLTFAVATEGDAVGQWAWPPRT